MLTNVRESSLEAFNAMQSLGKFGLQECRIMAFFKENAHRDFTRREIAHFLDMETGTVAARVNALIKTESLAERKDRRECEISKKNVTVVGLPLPTGQQKLFE
jgi:DNA-binding MarR family transcriptional regulator